MNSVLITGSNRGMGLEWARQYAQAGWRVYASCRLPELADELNEMAADHDQVSVHRLDVTKPDEIARLAAELGDDALDLLINNAGIYWEQWGRDLLGQIKYDDWQDTLMVNTLGAMRMSEALIEKLALSERGLIVAISSHMGSIAEITSPNDYAYRSSKAALNAAMKGLSLEVAERGVGVLLFHPGWVRTRMGGETAPLSARESVSAMRKLVDGYQPAQSGHFYRYDGTEIPW